MDSIFTFNGFKTRHFTYFLFISFCFNFSTINAVHLLHLNEIYNFFLINKLFNCKLIVILIIQLKRSVEQQNKRQSRQYCVFQWNIGTLVQFNEYVNQSH